MMTQLKTVLLSAALCLAACGDGDDVPELPPGDSGSMDAGPWDAGPLDARTSEAGRDE